MTYFNKKDARHIMNSFKKEIMPPVNGKAYATNDWMDHA
jgi:hypothetical protein